MTDEEINELVHTKIFGKCWHVTGGFERFSKYCRKCKEEISYQGMTLNGMENPNYAGSIADAFKVIEKLRERGYSASLTTPGFLYDFDSGMYQCQLENVSMDVRGEIEKDESLPKAICLAALQTLGD